MINEGGAKGPVLKGLAWDHPRCLLPMREAAAEWKRLTGVRVVWEARSLIAFGQQSLARSVRGFDLAIVDHPLIGEASRSLSLCALEGLIDEGSLRKLAADAVGPSHSSYSHGGSQWALALDAACQVSAVRDDLLGSLDVPTTWPDALLLARTLRGHIAIPMQSSHAISSFCTLMANSGHPLDEHHSLDDGAAAWALEQLQEIVSCAIPELLPAEPPAVLDALTGSDTIAYVPLIYGYITYSRLDRNQPCRFVDVPSAGLGPVGSTLGGAGLAIPSTSANKDLAAAFATWVCGEEAQTALVAPSGGQPASRKAWQRKDLDSAAGGFFSGTLRTIEAAWIRPREPWWPEFQRDGGKLISQGLQAYSSVSSLVRDLDECLSRCIEHAAKTDPQR